MNRKRMNISSTRLRMMAAVIVVAPVLLAGCDASGAFSDEFLQSIASGIASTITALVEAAILTILF